MALGSVSTGISSHSCVLDSESPRPALLFSQSGLEALLMKI